MKNISTKISQDTAICTYACICSDTYVYEYDMYMHMHMHMCMYMHICVYVYMYIYICVYVYMCILYMCICIYVYMYIRIYVYMYICIYVYMYICICIYIYRHAYVICKKTGIHTSHACASTSAVRTQDGLPARNAGRPRPVLPDAREVRQAHDSDGRGAREPLQRLCQDHVPLLAGGRLRLVAQRVGGSVKNCQHQNKVDLRYMILWGP